MPAINASHPIVAARIAKGLSQRACAKRLGMTPAALHYWEIDQNLPGCDRLQDLRTALAPHFDLDPYLQHAARVRRMRDARRAN